MTLAFSTLTAKPAPKPEPKKPAGPPLTDDVKTFAAAVASAEHGYLVENVDKKTVGQIKRVLSAHKAVLFGTFTPKFRMQDATTLRITLVPPAEEAKPAEAMPAETPAGE